MRVFYSSAARVQLHKLCVSVQMCEPAFADICGPVLRMQIEFTARRARESEVFVRLHLLLV